ncbi:MAG: hypothetical protein AAGA43_10235 [Bacteroidota bacterium]
MDYKKNNIYYLIAAFMMLISVFAHPYYGSQNLFPQLDSANIDAFVKQNLFMGWNMATSTSVICAIGLCIAGLVKDKAKVKLTVLLILGINIGRFLVVVFTGLIKGPEIFQDILVQSTYMLLFCMLLILGIRRDKKAHINHNY